MLLGYLFKLLITNQLRALYSCTGIPDKIAIVLSSCSGKDRVGVKLRACTILSGFSAFPPSPCEIRPFKICFLSRYRVRIRYPLPRIPALHSNEPRTSEETLAIAKANCSLCAVFIQLDSLFISSAIRVSGDYLMIIKCRKRATIF